MLAMAVSDPNSVRNFQSTLMECLRGDVHCAFRDCGISQEDYERKFHSNQKHNARECVHDQAASNFVVSSCKGCGVTVDGKKQCPCRTVSYVSRNVSFISLFVAIVSPHANLP